MPDGDQVDNFVERKASELPVIGVYHIPLQGICQYVRGVLILAVINTGRY